MIQSIQFPISEWFKKGRYAMNMIAGWLYFSILGVLFVIIPIMVGVYVYRDADNRGMNSTLWTLIAVLAPAFIGLIIYLIVRTDHTLLQCPNCRGFVTEQYNICPKCGAELKNKCAKCNSPLEPEWEVCANCGEPVPDGLKVPPLIVKKDEGLGKILLAVILIPLLIVILLIMGLLGFRVSNSSSITEMSDMRVEDFADNKVVSDWLDLCDAQGEGIYVLSHQQAAAAGGDGTESYYIIYRKGLTGSVEVSSGFSSGGLFKSSALEVMYTDSNLPPTADYHLYQVAQFTSDKPRLEIYVNGNEVDFVRTSSADSILFSDPMFVITDVANLFDARIDYVGDNSGVIRLIDATGLSKVGEYTIELKTDKEPYGLQIIYTSTDKELTMIDFSSSAIELLGLIKNLEYVEITGGTQTYTLNAEEASEILGYDVKELGRSKDNLEEYYKSLIDKREYL